MVTITTLVDNRIVESADKDLQCEHGLSFYIETEGLKILCDMGASDIFASNARCMGIDLSLIDFAILSHAHADHTGGLSYFLKHFNAPIYLSNRVFGNKYFSTRHTSKRDISCDETLCLPNLNRYNFVDRSCCISENISLVYCDSHRYALPYANSHLMVEPPMGVERNDDFTHEIALVITTSKGLVIVSSCSHNGAANIVSSCQRFTGVESVYAFVGGLHFVDGEYSPNEVGVFASEIAKLSPSTIFYTGHCTGTQSQELLQELLPNNVNGFYTGLKIEL